MSLDRTDERRYRADSDYPGCAAPDIDLGDARIVGKELAIREVRAEQQQCVAILHRREAGREAEQPGHADIVGIVVFDKLLAAQRVHDGCLQFMCELYDLVVSPGAASATKQKSHAGRRSKSLQGRAGLSRAAGRSRAAGSRPFRNRRCQGLQGHVARNDDDSHAFLRDGHAHCPQSRICGSWSGLVTNSA